MRNWHFLLPALFLLIVPAARSQSAFPFAESETLNYTIGWPSGLSVGELTVAAAAVKPDGGEIRGWRFEASLEAAVPGFKISDQYVSQTDSSLCSASFNKTISHGERTSREETRFDQTARTATRKTLDGGGESEISIPPCAMDGLAFLFHLRDELSRGRLPKPQKVFFGSAYEVTFQLVGSKELQIGDEDFEADQILLTVKGPASESSVVMAVARNEARTPLRVTVPLEPGNFTVELRPEE